MVVVPTHQPRIDVEGRSGGRRDYEKRKGWRKEKGELKSKEKWK
jgi:hypothetical protein